MYIDFHCHALLSKSRGFDPDVLEEYAAFAQYYPRFFHDEFVRPPRLDAICLTEHAHAEAYGEILDFLDRAAEERAAGVYLFRDVFFLAGVEVGIHERLEGVDYFGDALVLAPPATLRRVVAAVREGMAERPPRPLPGGGEKADSTLGIDVLRSLLGRGAGAPTEDPLASVLGAAHLFRRKSFGGRPLADLPFDRLLQFDYLETNGKDCDGHAQIVERCRKLGMWYLAGSDAHSTIQVGVACHHFPPRHLNRDNVSLPAIRAAIRGFLGDAVYDSNTRFRLAYAGFAKAFRLGKLGDPGSDPGGAP